jgi:hypothetical protein
MKVPDFKLRLIQFACAGCAALAATALGEPPETGSNKNAVSRTRPQVIYHLPPASNYAATLHSQAKGQNNEPPIDSSMPTSLQMSRGNPNASDVQPQHAATPSSRQRRVRINNRSPVRQKSFINSPGRGSSHGNKSHKK